MANLHKLSVQEALNTTVGGVWSVETAVNTGSSAAVANTIHKLLPGNTGTIGIYSAVEILFNFAAAETNVHANNDMIIPKNTLVFLAVPQGLGDAIYFNHNSTSTSVGLVRIVSI